MDFPLFHLDWAGNRALIGVIAVLHVFCNHPLAVGAMPLVALMEWWGQRRGSADWDRLAYRVLGVCFILTTSVGALTGVGIWFSLSLVNPAAIGSLIRVFFWAWFAEWLVFMVEVGLLLAYFLTWKRSKATAFLRAATKPALRSQNMSAAGAQVSDEGSNESRSAKRRHIRLGICLGVTSWLTMAIITAILGFMMDSGTWPERPTFLHGVLNPIHLPQLAFRTPLAMVTAGLFVMFLIPFFTGRGEPFRATAVRFVSAWTLAWAPPCALGAWAYWRATPGWMVTGNMPVALATQAFADWQGQLATLIGVAVVLVAATATWGLVKPSWLPRAALVVPFCLSLGLLGYYERVREFIRKPFVISEYMYANGLRKADYPLLAEQGLLAHATYLPGGTAARGEPLQRGEAVFAISCTRCHTTSGVNGVVGKLRGRFGQPPWDQESVKHYLRNMHNTRPFMPPVPGTEEELGWLTAYLLKLGQEPLPLEGAQRAGVRLREGIPASQGARRLG